MQPESFEEIDAESGELCEIRKERDHVYPTCQDEEAEAEMMIWNVPWEMEDFLCHC